MTIYLDATAFIARHIIGHSRDVVIEAMDRDQHWCTSAITMTETELLIERLEVELSERKALRRHVLSDWEQFHIIPVDAACLGLASRIGREQPVRTVEAIQLAAPARLPHPVSFATFDPNQIGPALALGYDVVSATANS